MQNIWQKHGQLIRQAVKFGAVGLINTALTQLIYNGLVWLGLGPTLAWSLGFGAGMVCSLLLNKRWTFAQRSALRPRQLLGFLLTNAAALVASAGAVALFTGPLALHETLSGLLATPVSLLVNFAGNKLFVFKDESSR